MAGAAAAGVSLPPSLTQGLTSSIQITQARSPTTSSSTGVPQRGPHLEFSSARGKSFTIR